MNKNQKCMNTNDGKFFVPMGSGSSKLEIKKSIFIADLTKVESKSETKNFINKVKKNYDHARHHCWAYVIGDPMNPHYVGSSDDGEPRGSASKSIINILNQNRVGYIAVVVTRYFSGTKLGIGGLKRAYSKSTSISLGNVKLKRFYTQKIVRSLVPYNFEGAFLHIANKVGASILDIKYRNLVVFKVSLNEDVYDNFLESIRNKTRNQVAFEAIQP